MYVSNVLSKMSLASFRPATRHHPDQESRSFGTLSSEGPLWTSGRPASAPSWHPQQHREKEMLGCCRSVG